MSMNYAVLDRNVQFMFQVIGVISVFFICISILSFCLKTHPDMRVPLIRNSITTLSPHA
jgi:potassium voltage-gated channel Shaw-related subfamily C protein